MTSSAKMDFFDSSVTSLPFGVLLRRIRLICGGVKERQINMAERAGVSRVMITQMEVYHRVPKDKTILRKLADSYGKSPAERQRLWELLMISALVTETPELAPLLTPGPQHGVSAEGYILAPGVRSEFQEKLEALGGEIPSSPVPSDVARAIVFGESPASRDQIISVAKALGFSADETLVRMGLLPESPDIASIVLGIARLGAGERSVVKNLVDQLVAIKTPAN